MWKRFSPRPPYLATRAEERESRSKRCSMGNRTGPAGSRMKRKIFVEDEEMACRKK